MKIRDYDPLLCRQLLLCLEGDYVSAALSELPTVRSSAPSVRSRHEPMLEDYVSVSK